MMEPPTEPLPEAFVDRLRSLIPADRFDAALASFGVDKPAGFRVNPLRGDPAETLAELRDAGLDPEPIAWCDHAFTLPASQRSTLTHHPVAGDGRVYLQNPASLLPGLLLASQPGDTVLDLAAAPGGKTLHVAAMMGGRGWLSAVEPVRDRFFKLKAAIERGGAGELVRCYRLDGQHVGKKQPGRFELTLLDAPCSGEARFDRRDPSTWQFWSSKKLQQTARKQKALLRSAIDATAPGGRILYATCSLAPEENELILAHTRRRLGDAIAIEPIDLPIDNAIPGLTAWAGKNLDPTITNARRVLPTAEMDAFFLTVLRKSDRA